MNYCKGRIGRLKTGPDGAFTHMNTGILDDLVIPYPPIGQQRKFENILFKARSQIEKLNNSLSRYNELFASLSQQAFKGELTQNKVA